MAQYKQAEITNIYWASNEGFKRGRDPLGIQNSSIATYSKLLPGLTNLTGHIRYYSLYCWLLSEYDILDKAKATTLHQYNFIRRAELALALIMKDLGVGSIIGANFVSQRRYKLIAEGIYNIADGADYDSIDKYWTFKSGALGQYYIGSLVYYELVKIEERRFYLYNKGKDLANAVRNSINNDVRKLFLEFIQSGRLEETEIEVLRPIAVNQVVVGSEEWSFLNNLLTKSDGNSSLRRESILLFLQDLSEGVKVEEFVKNRFLRACERTAHEAAFGWYFYYLCECLHYSIDTLFCLILDKIHELQNPPMGTLIQNIVESILFVIGSKEKDYDSLDEWRVDIRDNINVIYDELRNAVSKQDYISASVYAIRLMLRLYTEFENNAKAIDDFERENNLKRQRGIFSMGVKSYIERYLTFSISGFLESLIVQIMQEHTVVAIAKMGKNNSDLRKFIFEEDRIVLVERRCPAGTLPRVNSLFNFLQDLSYIDHNGKLTDIAKRFITSYGNE